MKVIACGESKKGEMMMRTVGMALVFGCETKGDALSEYFPTLKLDRWNAMARKNLFLSTRELTSCFFVRESTRSCVFISSVRIIGIFIKTTPKSDFFVELEKFYCSFHHYGRLSYSNCAGQNIFLPTTRQQISNISENVGSRIE